MAIERKKAPISLAVDNAPGTDIEVQIAPDEMEEGQQEDGSVVVDLSGGPHVARNDYDQAAHDANLAEWLTEDELGLLADELVQDYEDDLRSRREWEDTYTKGLETMGLRIEERTEPWDGACGIVHPLLAEAVVRFQAELITETFPAAGPVKTKILGEITREKTDAAERVRDDLNNEITDVMTEYRAEHERLLWNLPIAGSALKKVYFDPTLGRQTSMFVGAEDFIVAYGASDLATCPRYAHRMKKTANELKKLMATGFYRDIDIPDAVRDNTSIDDKKDEINGTSDPEDNRHVVLEFNVDLDLPHFENALGIMEPYIVTVEKSSRKVLSIRRNYAEDSKNYQKEQYFVHYTYIPGFGFYGFGLIHLVGGFAMGATSILRQLVDAGTLSNLPGGLKTRGLRIKGDDTPIAPGEWRDCDVPAGTLKENLVPLPYKEPSQVLAGLLQTIVDEGRKFAAVAEMKVSDFDSNSPVGTTMALLERTLKVMSSVQARIYAAMKLEFRLIRDLIKKHGSDTYTYTPAGVDPSIKRQDYEMVDVMPVADPNSATMSQRIVQWQAVMQLAAMAPQIYDLPELHGQMLEILGIKNIDKLLPSRKEDMKPVDPISENMAILNGKPVKAFISQDHDSHLAVHMAAIQDPKMQQMIGQNPMAQQIQGAAMAHIMEHVAFQYRAQVEQMAGVTLPAPDDKLDPNVEVQVSSLMAAAAQKLLGKNQNDAAQAQAQQQAQDPVLQLQQAQLALDQEKEANRKAQQDTKLELDKLKLLVETMDKEAKNAIAKMQIASQQTIAGAQIGAQAVQHAHKTDAQAHQAGMQLGHQAIVHIDGQAQQDKDRAHQLELAAKQAANKPTGDS